MIESDIDYKDEGKKEKPFNKKPIQWILIVLLLLGLIWSCSLSGNSKKNNPSEPNHSEGNGQSDPGEDVEDDDGEDDEDPRWFRELRIDGWTLLIGNDTGILSVKDKLETMYGAGAPEIKVDQANKEFSEGNWHYEFVQLAEQAIAENNYQAAIGYYTLAAYPEAYQDERAVEMYSLAWATFQKELEQGVYPYKTITVNVDGVDISAFLVYPKSFNEGDSVPVAIETGGVDSLVTFNFANYLMHWNEANFAWIGFDMPGFGTSNDIRLTPEAEKVHVAVIEALQADNSIDNNNIFVIGRSLGGYAALKLIATQKADELNLAGVIAFCPTAEYLYSMFEEAEDLENVNPMSISTWAARTGMDPENAEEFLEHFLQFSFSSQGLWGETVSSVPLLIYNTGEDSINPIEEIQEMASLSTKGKYIIAEPEFADDDGHCGCRKQALTIFAEFVEEYKR